MLTFLSLINLLAAHPSTPPVLAPIRDSLAALAADVARLCPAEQLPASKLQEVELSLSSRLERSQRDASWDSAAVHLACVRATEATRNVVAQQGFLMPLGTRSIDGAITLLMTAIRSQPRYLAAVKLLAELAPVAVRADTNAVFPDGARYLTGQQPGPIGNQLFQSVVAGVADSGAYRACSSMLLQAGDFLGARECSSRALANGADSTWHLLRLAYIAFHLADSIGGSEDFRGAVAAAHDKQSRREVAWHLDFRSRTVDIGRGRGPPFVLAAMDSGLTADWMSQSDSVRRLRWVDRRLQNAAQIAHEPIAAVLGHHFFVVTYARGAFRSCTQSYANWGPLFVPPNQAGSSARPMPRPPCAPVLDPEIHEIPIAASRFRLWDSQGLPISVLTDAVAVSGLAPSGFSDQFVQLVLHFRERDGASGAWTDTTFIRRRPVPEKREGALEEVVVLPRRENASDWAVAVTQSAARRGILDHADPPIREGPLALSDIVVGQASQHLAWTSGDDSVVLAPLGSIDRKEAVDLFVQVRTEQQLGSATATFRAYRVDHGKRADHAAIQIVFPMTLPTGLAGVHKGLDLSHIHSGRYLLEFSVKSAGLERVQGTEILVR